MKEHKICKVIEGSIAWEMEIEPNDVLLKINDKEIEDIFDYHYLLNDEYIVVLIRKENGEEWEIEIEKEVDEDLGIEFEQSLMDNYKSCRNKCIFCFIDQFVVLPNFHRNIFREVLVFRFFQLDFLVLQQR